MPSWALHQVPTKNTWRSKPLNPHIKLKSSSTHHCHVTITVVSPQKKAYDLDAKGFFWVENTENTFPQVTEDIDMELNKYKQDAAEITWSTGVSYINAWDIMFGVLAHSSEHMRCTKSIGDNPSHVSSDNWSASQGALCPWVCYSLGRLGHVSYMCPICIANACTQ